MMLGEDDVEDAAAAQLLAILVRISIGLDTITI